MMEQSYGDYDEDCFQELKKTFPSHSGSGILEFSPEKAGLDVTPANYNFPVKVRNKLENSSLAGVCSKIEVRTNTCKPHGAGMLDQLKRSVTDLTFGK